MDNTALYQGLLQAFSERRWDGEIDSWAEAIPREAWSSVTTDHRGCTNNRCAYFKQCPFFQARNRLEGTDVIVANHDLVLADLSLGGGAVLPDPDDAIYIVDEAHHLPEKTQQHFSASGRIRSTQIWLDNVQSVIGSLTQRFGRPDELVNAATRIADFSARAGETLSRLDEAVGELPFEPRDDTLETCRFPVGQVPEAISGVAKTMLEPFAALADELERTHAMLGEVQEGKREWERGFEADDWLGPVGQLQTRAHAMLGLIEAYSKAGQGRC